MRFAAADKARPLSPYFEAALAFSANSALSASARKNITVRMRPGSNQIL